MDIVPTNECFICAKELSADSPTIETNLECNCVQCQPIHKHCFDEWYEQKGTCPVCRSTGPDTEAIRLHVRETVRLAQTANEEHIRKLNLYKSMLLLILFIIFLSLIGVFFILHDDDVRLHSHDDDDFAQIDVGP